MNLISRIVIYLILLTSMGMAYNTLGIGVNVANPLQSATFYHNKIYYGADFLHIGISAYYRLETDYVGESIAQALFLLIDYMVRQNKDGFGFSEYIHIFKKTPIFKGKSSLFENF